MVEQQPKESYQGIDPELVQQVISLTREMNRNLAAVIRRNDQVILRQNVLIGLFVCAMVLMVLQLFLGYNQQKMQESAHSQLELIEHAREDLQVQVNDLVQSVRSVDRQLSTVPTVKPNAEGKLQLEVPLNEPEKLVIPLKQDQSRVE